MNEYSRIIIETFCEKYKAEANFVFDFIENCEEGI